MEFRINGNGWDVTVNLTDPLLVDIYNQNPAEFQAYIQKGMYSQIGNTKMPAEIKPIINQMEDDLLIKKRNLANGYINSDSN
jgi:hypothetical protein